MKGWHSCQMGDTNIFQVRNGQIKCRALEMRTRDKFLERSLTDYPGQVRYGPSLCKVGEKHAFLIGGMTEGNFKTYLLKTCMRYDMMGNFWDLQMPQMQVARCNSSSCMLGDRLYVFCGVNSTENSPSVERLVISESINEQKCYAWEAITISNISENFNKRQCQVVCPLPIWRKRVLLLR